MRLDYIVWKRKWRKKFLTNFRALAIMLSVAVQQCIGYIVYAFFCETPICHKYFYYTDGEYESYGLYLYPGIEAILDMGIFIVSTTYAFAIPYIILFFAEDVRNLYRIIKYDK